MRFLTNTHNPNDVEMAKMSLAISIKEFHSPNGREQAWKRHLEYLSDKIIGEPQATKSCTVEQLKKMGIVGVYAKD